MRVGAQAGATVYEQGTDKDPVEIAGWALERAREDGKDVLIVDTSGRLHIDDELMQELARIRERVKPHCVLLVVDAMTGQDAVNVAESFAEAAQFDGVVISKLDGDARGGAALSVRRSPDGRSCTPPPGEARPVRTLPPRPHGAADPRHGRRDEPDREGRARVRGGGCAGLERKLRKDEFGLDDMLEQLRAVRKMGPLTSVLGMIPGLPGEPVALRSTSASSTACRRSSCR